MNGRVKRIWHKKILKRILSAFLIAVLVLGEPCLWDSGWEKIFAEGETENEETPTPDIETDSRFLHVSDSDPTVKIKHTELVDYSKAYAQHPSYHQFDNVIISAGGGANQDAAYFAPGFMGLGTEGAPFGGSLSILAGNAIQINLDHPLFNYVFDNVTIANNGSALLLSREFNFDQDTQLSETNLDAFPLLAMNVIHNPGNNSSATWEINVSQPDNTTEVGETVYLGDFGGFIGRMCNDSRGAAQLTLNVTMNKTTADQFDVGVKGMEGCDVGLICGTMDENTSLTVTLTADRRVKEISSNYGHAGGLIGSMAPGSTFSYTGTNIQNDNTIIKTECNDKFAGGIVGYNDGGSVTINLPSGTTEYPLKQYVEGKAGAGVIYGYYQPAADAVINASFYDVNCQVNGTGYVGGLIGVLESSVNVSITDSVTVTSSHASGSASGYGGLIGRYDNTDLTKKLLIEDVTAKPSRSSTATYYGGAVAFVGTSINEQSETVGGSAYVMLDGFTLSTAGGADSMTFGGLIARADNAFVDAKDVTIGVSGSNYKGGGLVGRLKSGVLRMTGTTDISGAKTNVSDAYNQGQIVGYRDCALVFAEKDWKLNRYASGVSADDIGSWGEVIRFNAIEQTTTGETVMSTQEKFGENVVATVDEVNHYVTVSAVTASEGSYDVGTVADFAKIALHMQLFNSQTGGVLRFAGSTDYLSSNITLSDDIDLSGTGLGGFTRDNASADSVTASKCVFTGNFDGKDHAITIAFGEPYGYLGNDAITGHTKEGFGKIYRHRYIGLFGITNTGSGNTAQNVSLDGKIYVNAQRDPIYVGALAGLATGLFEIDDVHLTDTVTSNVHSTVFQFEGGKSGSNENSFKIYAGGLLGQAHSGITSISINDSSADCNIHSSNTTANSCYGGIIGCIDYTGQTATWTFTGVTVSGIIQKTHASTTNKLGGLIAAISRYNGTSKRTMVLTDVSIKGLTISAVGSSSSDSGVHSAVGGLLGYTWLDVNPTFHNVVIDKNGTVGNEVSLSGTASNKGDLAGLVYQGTGYWKVEVNDGKEGINIKDLTVTASNARSFGMILNRGIATGDNGYSSAIYLEILGKQENVKSYAIDAAISTLTAGANQLSGLASGCIFDELVAYSASDGKVLENGQGIVSIHSDFTTDGTSSSESYHAQTSRGNVPNEKTRYYYNIDLVRTGTSDADFLMRWALKLYAHKNIRDYFALGSGFSITRDDGGNVTATTIPDGTYDMEDYSWYPVDMSGVATINGTFKFYNNEFEDSEAAKGGTYSYTRTSLFDATNNKMTQHHLMHCGLFRNVSGGVNIGSSGITLQGNVGRAKGESGALICGTIKGSSTASIASFTTNGNITLSGIFVHHHNSDSYAPLLINKIGEYATIDIRNVKAESGAYGDDFKAASSLVGDVGSSTATNVNLTFSNIQLDARKTTSAYGLDSVYNTKSSLFYRATLLNTLRYVSGSGTYNYDLSEDWIENSGTYVRTGAAGVTYGSEIDDPTSQHLGKEYWYKDTNGGIYTNYNTPGASGSSAPSPAIVFSGFLPYVYSKCTASEINTAMDKKYQLKVNWADTQMSGCGTYNDPYILTKASDFQDIADILNGTFDASVTVRLPNLNSQNNRFNATDLKKKKWDDYGDAVYTYVSGSKKYCVDGTNGYDRAVVQNYLAGAYYKIKENTNIRLDSDFTGFCNQNSEESVFRGVIVGNGEYITLTGDSPLIFQSNGSVIKGINIVVDKASAITINQDSPTTFAYGTSGTGRAYGAVIGKIMGGDNIIDDVTVSFKSSQIQLTGNAAQSIPVGGYVGVVVKGTLVFRGMEKYRASSLLWESISGLGNATVKDASNNTNLLYTNAANKTPNMKWLYVNPIVGRVINAAVFTEGDAYRPFENGTRDGVFIKTSAEEADPENADAYISIAVDTEYEKYSQPVTMKNGTKNYSIADITDNLPMFTTEIPERTSDWKNSDSINDDFRHFLKIDIGIPNAQAMYVMSLVTQSGLGGTNFLQRYQRGRNHDDSNYYPSNYNKPVGGFLNTGSYGLAPYYKYRSTHVAGYAYVGACGGANISEPSSGQAWYEDYNKAKTDNAQFNRSGTTSDHAWQHGLEAIPYIIGKFTPKLSSDTTGHAANAYDPNYFNNINGKELGYVAFSLTQQYSYLNLEFTASNSSYYMPDGFRGLGFLGYKNFDNNTNNTNGWPERYQDLIVHIFGIEGNGNTISLNMSLYSYYQIGSKDDAYAVDDACPGFGFIDAMMQNKTCAVGRAVSGRYNDLDVSNSDYQIRNLTLTGVVKSEVIDASSGNNYPFNSNLNSNKYVPVGGLVGNVVYRVAADIFKVAISDVSLSNLRVSGVRSAGGLMGYNQSANDIDSKTTIKTIRTSELEVSSGIYAGGLIGYSTQTALDISDVVIAEPNIISKLNFPGGSYTANATGGVIGYAATNTANDIVYLHGITMGTQSPSGNSYNAYIGYNKDLTNNVAANETVRVGGLIGQIATNSSSNISDSSPYNTKIDMCYVYNVDIRGHKAGGIIGASEKVNNTNTCYVGIFDTLVKSSPAGEHYVMGQLVANNDTGGAGGILGYADGLNNRFTVQNCSVQGYVLTSERNSGGIVGSISGSDSYKIKICDTSVCDLVLHSTQRTGGLIGYLNKSLDGYNILTKNLQFGSPTTTAISDYGNIVGFNNNKTIKIAGFTRQDLTDDNIRGSGYVKRAQMVGNKTNANTPYGSSGYVIFADYEGKCLSESTRSVMASPINAGNNVASNHYFVETMTNDAVGNYFPYVTTSPKKFIGNNTGTQFITGDAVGQYGAGTFKLIINDTTAARRYENINDSIISQRDAITSKMSTAYAEFTNAAYPRGATNENFPLLVVDDNNYRTVTQMINAYINALANTSGVNYAEDNDIHRISLNKCTYDSANQCFTIDTNSNSACLRRGRIAGEYCFRMTGARVDNENLNVAQFSLLDVQFLDPSDVTQVAYHLYIPIYVRKVLQFEFSAGVLSNTEYYPSAYTQTGNVIFENLGNPVTMKFQYKYDRTATEWMDAINGGESVLNNLNKVLSISYHSAAGVWPEGTKMVLVDANNGDRCYYLDTAPNGNTLDLRSFTDGAGNPFSVSPLQNLLTGVTVGQPTDTPRTLVATSADDARAVVKSGDTYYRMVEDTEEDNEIPEAEKYAVISIESVKEEEYYLSIFTPTSASDTNVYHYGIQSVTRLEKTGEGDQGWRPNEIKTVSGQRRNDTVGLFTGKLYENNLTMEVSSGNFGRELNADNDYLSVKMTSTISLCGDNTQKTDVANNMQTNKASSTIYQTFLVTYDMKDAVDGDSKVGIQASILPDVVFLNYDLYGGSSATGTALEHITGEDHITENHVELRNNKNLIDELSKAGNSYAVTVDLGFRLKYDDHDSMFYQFPANENGNAEVGTRVIGYSNIASSNETAAYSATSKKEDGETVRYYTANSKKATLKYNVVKTRGEIAGPYSDLGINALDMEGTTQTIHTQAQYDVSKLKERGDYIEFTIQLSDKFDYNTSLPFIEKYIDNLKIKGLNDVILFDQASFDDQTEITTYDGNGKLLIKATKGTDCFTLRVLKSQLKTLGNAEDGRYVIPVEFDVFTGDEKFNEGANGLAYSNYRVNMTAKMIESANDPSTKFLTPSFAADYVIYTNAKVFPDVIVVTP